MAVQGAFTVFDNAKLYFANGSGLLLPASSFKAVLCSTGQVLSESFVGGSGDARYADLTAELATGNGYTAPGVALTGLALTRTSPTVEWSSAPASWTLTGAGITFKYFVIYNLTLANQNLVGYCDMDTSGGSVSPNAGALSITPNASGWFSYG